jgi:hypothetical protein
MSYLSVVLVDEEVNEEHRKIVAMAKPDGSLLIDGVDMGPVCEEILGDFDYEYSLTIPSTDLPKLVIALSRYGKPETANPMTASQVLLKEGFRDDLTFKGIRDLCEKNGIEANFFSWT